MADTCTWIGAYGALKKAELVYGSRQIAKETLAEHLRDGELRARSKAVWTSEELSLDRAWKSSSQVEDSEEHALIPPRFWQASKRWRLDGDSWRWPMNKFSTTIRLKPRKWNMARGVEFCSDDLHRILQRKIPSAGGSPGKPAEWIMFWHAVIGLAQAERLTRAQFPTQAALRLELLALINDGLGETVT